MLRLIPTLFAATVLFAHSNPAHAQATPPFKPTERLSLPVRGIPDRAVDILGIRTGMTAGDAEAKLKAHGLPYRKIEKNLGGTFNGVSVRTEPYVAEIRAENDVSVKPHERIEIQVTSPASGNRVAAAKRVLLYSEPARNPEIDGLKQAVIDKYGKPSEIKDDGITLRIMYYFRAGKQVACSDLSKLSWQCQPFSVYQPELAGQYAAEAKGDDFVIEAMMQRPKGQTRAYQFWVQIADWAIRDKGSKADTEAVIAEAERIIKSTRQTAAPKL